MVLNSIKNHIFPSVMTIKYRVFLRSICSNCQNGPHWHCFLIFPPPFYSNLKLCFTFYYIHFASNFKHLVKGDKGYKHIHKSNNHSRCFRSQSSFQNLYSGYLFSYASQNARLYMDICILLKYKLRFISISLPACFLNIQSKGANETKLIRFAALYKWWD